MWWDENRTCAQAKGVQSPSQRAGVYFEHWRRGVALAFIPPWPKINWYNRFMPVDKKQSEEVSDYIKAFPKDVRVILEKIRQTIAKMAPDAEEKISYGIPAFNLNRRNLIYFTGWKNHVSLYPIPVGTEAFQKEISPYVSGKGTVRFPIEKPIPYDLVKKIALAHVKRLNQKK